MFLLDLRTIAHTHSTERYFMTTRLQFLDLSYDIKDFSALHVFDSRNTVSLSIIGLQVALMIVSPSS